MLRCERMFRFARGERDDISIDITLDDARQKAVSTRLYDYPGFTEMLKRLYTGDLRPPVRP